MNKSLKYFLYTILSLSLIVNIVLIVIFIKAITELKDIRESHLFLGNGTIEEIDSSNRFNTDPNKKYIF